MEEQGVKEWVNNSQVYIWENALQYITLPVALSYSNIQVGDFVQFDSNRQISRSPSGGADSTADIQNYQGVVVGIAPNSGAYPAFGAHYNQPLVALLSPNKTELIMRQIDNLGNYMANPSLKAGDLTIFVYNTNTNKWGVQPHIEEGSPPTGRVVEVLSDGRLVILLEGTEDTED
jgi:hypothetical protein